MKTLKKINKNFIAKLPFDLILHDNLSTKKN